MHVRSPLTTLSPNAGDAPRFDATWTTGGFFNTNTNTNSYSSTIALDKPTLTVAGKSYAPVETHTRQGEGLSRSEVTTIYEVPAGQAVMTLSGTARHESTLSSNAGEGAPKTGKAAYPVKTKITLGLAS